MSQGRLPVPFSERGLPRLDGQKAEFFWTLGDRKPYALLNQPLWRPWTIIGAYRKFEFVFTVRRIRNGKQRSRNISSLWEYNLLALLHDKSVVSRNADGKFQ